jgi:Thrombospondin type 3 repeat
MCVAADIRGEPCMSDGEEFEMRSARIRRLQAVRFDWPVATLLVCLALLALPSVSVAGSLCSCDTDNDTVVDSLDNCVLVPNAGTRFCDTDQDGYGNACDPDTNNDGVVGGPDFGTFTASFGATGATGANVADLNCDGVVGGPDFGTFTSTFGKAPGPSGLSCAGAIPCN